uniref:Diacylglycerol kinase n=1 Tax=Amphiprion ocellaris TaxID=80972 RepID=A0AAQ5ZQL9_AMPOC
LASEARGNSRTHAEHSALWPGCGAASGPLGCLSAGAGILSNPGFPPAELLLPGSAPGHCFRKVTLTKPTFCHSCSDFIWGIVGFLCEGNTRTHTDTQTPRSRFIISGVTENKLVPILNWFISFSFNSTICELHVHADCSAFTCADCRSSHLDGTLELQDTFHHHWREGNLASASRCEVCRRSCGSSDVLAGMRCEWCGITSHAACYLSVPPECTLGRLRCMLLHPSCVRLDSRNFSKMHNYRIAESCNQDLDNSDDVDSSAAVSKENQSTAADSGKQFLKVFEGDDAVKRGFFRLVSICRATRNEEVVEASLRCFFLPGDSQDFQLQEVGGMQRLHGDDILNRNGGSLKDGGDAWMLRSKPRDDDVIQVFAGAVALQISCFSEAERIYMLAKDTSINDKPLSSLVVPEILCNRLGADICPLLVFVNPKSGGLKGRELLYSFRKLLNPHQVFDISNGGPLAGLHTFREVPRFRVLVCGGDGTVGWVLGVLEAVRHKLVCREPPIGIVPLGTGNDLARILRWGTGYSGEDPHHILVSVDEADEVLMDRWTILLDAQDISEDGKNNGFLEPPKIVQMNNYFGIGIDAELSLDFHLAREDEPDKFTSRFHNKGVYVKVGLQKISHTRSLHKELQLQVDAQNIPLPNIEGLIFLNIPSWGAGADLWGSEVDGRFGKPSIDDGLLEVVGVTGVVHMGQVQSGLRSGIRIAQGNYIRLTVSKPIPVQVDGEPWIQPPGHIIISAAGPKVRMLRKSKQKQKKSSANTRDGRSESPSSRDGGH